MHWIYLAGAIVLEVMGTTAMKVSFGFSRLIPSVLVVVCYVGAFFLLALSLKRLDVSVAYAIWAGLGTAAIAVIGFFFFHESVTLLKVVSLGLIVVGVVGLNLAGSGGH